ncbi:MAG: PQQ-binding-like beta-propeller repeat protein [Planctomycetota bacterium]|nr:PQQ-binding-like beta-propeller repeat protein [Planctomycetota bacterium]
MNATLRKLISAGIVLWGSFATHADDWPMWRGDARRSASSNETLPAGLRLLWRRDFGPRQQVWDDPLNHDLMTYDRIFEPIVMDERLFVGFNDQDKLTALDAQTGEELWSFFTEGPVRVPPAGHNGRVYFCSDDGFLYCVDAATGRLYWKLRGGPSAQHAIGNQRIVSAWVARGGPVIRDETVYFAASIWPFMGTFIYAIDAETGSIQWVNDSTGSQYIKQPHSAPSFAGVAPQGVLVATEEMLLVPGGRSVPAAFDRRTGEFRYFNFNEGGKGTGGSFLAADEKHFYVHTRLRGTRAFGLKGGVTTAFMPNEPVLSEGLVFAAADEKGKALVRAFGPDQKMLWEIDVDATGDLIRCGEHLVAAGKDWITAVRLPSDSKSKAGTVDWKLPATGTVQRLLAADGKLFAVTLEGSILCYGLGSRETHHLEQSRQAMTVQKDVSKAAADILSVGDGEGYAFWFGSADDELIDAVAANSPFVQLAVVDSDKGRVDRLRQRMTAAGLYGRVTSHQSEAATFMPPQHVAHMVFVGRDIASSGDSRAIAEIYKAVRPYGGVMYLLADRGQAGVAATIQEMNLEQAEVSVTPYGIVVRRVGALPGSADWTHQYGDIGNTAKSNDSRVKLPLGVLWFGGSSNMDVLPRHGHGPTEQIIDGRLFIQGMNSLSARDVYTGRVLWKREFKNLGTFDVYYDSTYRNTPLDPQYNQVHIPGANGRGTNYVVASDRVYIVEGDTCHVLDPATGETLQDIRLPADSSDGQREWGYLGVYKDVLIGGLGFANYLSRGEIAFDGDKELSKNKAGFGGKSLDRAASLALVGFDRHSGEQLWKMDAVHSFWHNGIVAGNGRIFCLDRNPKRVEEVLKRRGKASPDTYRILAIDHRTGQQQWQINENIFGTWLGYSEAKDALLQAGASASDRLSDESGTGMAVYSGSDGKVRWQNNSLSYSGPCILHNDLIITNANSYKESAGAFRIDNGQQKLIANPLTGELQPWKITRAYGCNSIIASENLLTFRSGAAGFYDLLTDSGTGNLGGFKSGCTSNLVVANGVLNAPDYTRTCSCSYQNQTSLALVHMPEMEMWTVNIAAAAADVNSEERPVNRIGINFGAPGDRRDHNGLLWLEYPVVAGESPPLAINVDSNGKYFRRHGSTMDGRDLPWVLASGVAGASEIAISLKSPQGSRRNAGIAIEHGSDDAEENEKGQVVLTSSDLEFVEDRGPQIVGLRFNKLNLPRNARIRKAFIQFACDEPSTSKTTLIIGAEKSANAERFKADSHDISSRDRTTAVTAWQPTAWPKVGEAGDAQRTPDLSAMIREVVSLPDWEPGNSLAFLISGSGKRVAEAFDGDDKLAPRLFVETDETDETETNSPSRPGRQFRVRLLFGAPRQAGLGRSVFDVYLQDRLVLRDVELDPDVAASSAVVHTVDDVMVADSLRIRFASKQGEPMISGVELISAVPGR